MQIDCKNIIYKFKNIFLRCCRDIFKERIKINKRLKYRNIEIIY